MFERKDTSENLPTMKLVILSERDVAIIILIYTTSVAKMETMLYANEATLPYSGGRNIQIIMKKSEGLSLSSCHHWKLQERLALDTVHLILGQENVIGHHESSNSYSAYVSIFLGLWLYLKLDYHCDLNFRAKR